MKANKCPICGKRQIAPAPCPNAKEFAEREQNCAVLHYKIHVCKKEEKEVK
jgi:hypothetical protein